MEDLTIDGWAVWMIVTFGGGWIYWMIVLTKMANKANNDNAINERTNLAIQKDIQDLNTKIDETKKDFHESLKGMSTKLDIIFGEFQFMKGLASQQANKPV